MSTKPKKYAVELELTEEQLDDLKRLLESSMADGQWWERLEGRGFVLAAERYVAALDPDSVHDNMESEAILKTLEVYKQVLNAVDVNAPIPAAVQ